MSKAKNPVSGSVTPGGEEEAPPATTTTPLAWKVPGKADDVAATSANNPAADKVGTVTATLPDEPAAEKKPTDEAAKQAKKVADAKAAVALEEERGKANAQAEAEMGFAATKKEKVPENLIWLAIAAIVIGLLIFIAVQLSSRKPGDVAATPPAPTVLTAPAATEWSKGGSQPSEY